MRSDLETRLRNEVDTLQRQVTKYKRRVSRHRRRTAKDQGAVAALEDQVAHQHMLVQVRDHAMAVSRAAWTTHLEAQKRRANQAEDFFDLALQEMARLEGELDGANDELEDTVHDVIVMEGDGALLLCRLRDLEHDRAVLQAANIQQGNLLQEAARSQMQLDHELDTTRQQLEAETEYRQQLARVLDQERRYSARQQQQLAASETWLAAALDEVQDELEQLLQARRQTAQFIADQSGCAAVADESWLAFVLAMGEGQQPLGVAEPTRSWTVLKAWFEGDGDAAEEGHPPLQPPTSTLLDMLCRLHGLRLDGRLDSATTRLLGHLREAIMETPAGQPMARALLAYVLRGFLPQQAGSLDDDVACVLGAWSLAELLVSRWPADANLLQIRNALEARLTLSPLAFLRGVVQGDGLPQSLLALPPRVQTCEGGSRGLFFPRGAQGRLPRRGPGQVAGAGGRRRLLGPPSAPQAGTRHRPSLGVPGLLAVLGGRGRIRLPVHQGLSGPPSVRSFRNINL
ncbi:hypothetical protein PG989_006528 [Apiospora arundinis]